MAMPQRDVGSMKTGLVFEGGAMRGLFTAGVLDALMERGIKFDGLAGVSAGACFDCNYKRGQTERVIRYKKRFASDPRLGFDAGRIAPGSHRWRTVSRRRTFRRHPTSLFRVARLRAQCRCNDPPEWMPQISKERMCILKPRLQDRSPTLKMGCMRA